MRQTIVFVIAVEVIGLVLLLAKGVAIYQCEKRAFSLPHVYERYSALLACEGVSTTDLERRERKALQLLDAPDQLRI